MRAAVNTSPGPSAAKPLDTMNPSGVNTSATTSEQQRKEERLIALYMDLTGANEATARSVYMHLGLEGRNPPDGRPV